MVNLRWRFGENQSKELNSEQVQISKTQKSAKQSDEHAMKKFVLTLSKQAAYQFIGEVVSKEMRLEKNCTPTTPTTQVRNNSSLTYWPVS